MNENKKLSDLDCQNLLYENIEKLAFIRKTMEANDDFTGLCLFLDDILNDLEKVKVNKNFTT